MHQGTPDLRVVGGEAPAGFDKHLEFFDLNRDQKISVGETRKGLQRLGLGHLLSFTGSLAINLGVAGLGLSQGHRLNPANLAIDQASFVRHPDTELVDKKGVFDEAKLHALFARYGKTFAGDALTLLELGTMLAAQLARAVRESKRDLLLLPAGANAMSVEWAVLFWIAGTKSDGKRVLRKEDLLRFYSDPRFLHDVADQVAQQRAERSQTTLGVLRNVLQDWLL